MFLAGQPDVILFRGAQQMAADGVSAWSVFFDGFPARGGAGNFQFNIFWRYARPDEISDMTAEA